MSNLFLGSQPRWPQATAADEIGRSSEPYHGGFGILPKLLAKPVIASEFVEQLVGQFRRQRCVFHKSPGLVFVLTRTVK
jgi:hypothetical protein